MSLQICNTLDVVFYIIIIKLTLHICPSKVLNIVVKLTYVSRVQSCFSELNPTGMLPLV